MDTLSTKLYTATKVHYSTLSNEEWYIEHNHLGDEDSCELYFEFKELIDYSGSIPSGAMIAKFESMGYNMDYVK